jgi:hypothetical protein
LEEAGFEEPNTTLIVDLVGVLVAVAVKVFVAVKVAVGVAVKVALATVRTAPLMVEPEKIIGPAAFEPVKAVEGVILGWNVPLAVEERV